MQTALVVNAFVSLSVLYPPLSRSLSEIPDAAVPVETLRGHLFGIEQEQALAAIRATVPQDGSYALVIDGDGDEGPAYWARYGLAPRKAIFLGKLSSLNALRAGKSIARGLAVVVVSSEGGTAPRIYSRRSFLQLLTDREAAAH